MKDKVILYICLNNRSGGEEHRALLDCRQFLKKFKKIIFYCLKNSWIDFELDEIMAELDPDGEYLEKIYHQGKLRRRSSSIRFYFKLRSILQIYSVNLVHLYGTIGLAVIGMVVRRFVGVSLLLTCYETHRVVRGLFNRYFFSRVDSIITLAQPVKDHISLTLPVRASRIRSFGAGLIFPPVAGDRTIKKMLPDGKRMLASKIPDNIRDLSLVQPVLRALHRFHSQTPKVKFNFVFVIQKDWISTDLYTKLVSDIKKFELDDMVDFVTEESFYLELVDFDLWIEIDDTEIISPEEILLAGCGIPMIVPRSGIRRDFLSCKMGLIGETYRQKDSRELAAMLTRLFDSYSSYAQAAMASSEKIRKEHERELYFQRVTQHYEELIKRRDWVRRRTKS